MQAVLGNPPVNFLDRSERSLQFWDKNGLCSHPFPGHFYKCVYNLAALIIIDLLHQVIGKTQLISQILILSRWKKDSKAMRRPTFYVFSDECYVGYQKKELLQKSFYLILG